MRGDEIGVVLMADPVCSAADLPTKHTTRVRSWTGMGQLRGPEVVSTRMATSGSPVAPRI